MSAGASLRTFLKEQHVSLDGCLKMSDTTQDGINYNNCTHGTIQCLEALCAPLKTSHSLLDVFCVSSRHKTTPRAKNVRATLLARNQNKALALHFLRSFLKQKGLSVDTCPSCVSFSCALKSLKQSADSSCLQLFLKRNNSHDDVFCALSPSISRIIAYGTMSAAPCLGAR